MLGHTPVTEERIARWRQRVWTAVHTARTDQGFRAASRHSSDDSASLARRGWHAVRARQTDLARRSFQAALHHDPYAVAAWLGLSRVATTHEERRAYLQIALDIQFLLADTGRPR
jgi:Tfp pilus assembly protein PilF